VSVYLLSHILCYSSLVTKNQTPFLAFSLLLFFFVSWCRFVLPHVLPPETAAAAVAAGRAHVQALAAADAAVHRPPAHPAAWLAESFRGPGLGWVQARPPSLVPFEAASRTTGNALRWSRFEKAALQRRAEAAEAASAPQVDGGR
jgi:hypothetical protein